MVVVWTHGSYCFVKVSLQQVGEITVPHNFAILRGIVVKSENLWLLPGWLQLILTREELFYVFVSASYP